MGLNFSKANFGALCLSSISVKFSMDQGPELLRAYVSVAAINSVLYKTWKLTTSQIYSLIQERTAPK